MSKISNGEGFIYVYPCIMGGTKNLCKIGVTDYGFLVLKEEVKVDTTKPVFEALRDKILSKYNDELPEGKFAINQTLAIDSKKALSDIFK